MAADSHEWAAHYLLSLGCCFSVARPDDLRDALHALASELVATADRPAPAVHRDDDEQETA